MLMSFLDYVHLPGFDIIGYVQMSQVDDLFKIFSRTSLRSSPMTSTK